MQTELKMTFKLFGALRQYGENSVVQLNIPATSSVLELKKSLSENLKLLHPEFENEAILGECAFATEERVLDLHETVPNVSYIAVLPPVCGG